jgi:transcriptional regulator with XRE-family HTH domain
MACAIQWAEATPVGSAEDLGRTINVYRRRLTLSQQRIAEATGIEGAVVSELERGCGDSAEFRAVLLVVNALGLDIELRRRGTTPPPLLPVNVTELGLSAGTLDALRQIGIERVDRLPSVSELLARPEFRAGSEVYEIVCALSRFGLSLPPHRCVPDARDREMLRLRIVEAKTFKEVGKRCGVTAGRVRQIMVFTFGLRSKPPAARRSESA